MKDNSLQNVENYKKDSNDLAVSYNEMDIYMKYVNVINQYLLFGIETIKNQNLEYLKYILIKGLFTISHVFKMLLLFTQNLDLTYHHCQKSYSYYIEFIGQIGDDAVTYLQLNSKDAALFVYKKTIFDINQEYKKNYYETKSEEMKNKIVSILIELYNKIIETELTQLTPEQLQVKNVTIINKIQTNIGNVNDKLYKLYYSSQISASSAQSNGGGTHADNGELLYNKLMYIKQFCDVIISRKNAYGETIDNHCEKYKDYIKTIEYFIKKIRKLGPIDAIRVESLNSLLTIKYFSHEFEERMKMGNTLKFINWIFLPQQAQQH
jgi:hypothetical protein